ncbi:hypothetical protein FRC09_018266 [Ceratobasidium sp. 395]|nr:hypothetical protein FRC09_018266 [Ceratobasidium sp. 395]
MPRILYAKMGTDLAPMTMVGAADLVVGVAESTNAATQETGATVVGAAPTTRMGVTAKHVSPRTPNVAEEEVTARRGKRIRS